MNLNPAQSKKCLSAVGCLLLAAAVQLPLPSPARAQSEHGFTFVRIQYDDTGGRRGRGFRGYNGGFWRHDYPTAELNLLEVIERTTGLHVDNQYVVLSLKEDRIFEYPILYLCEPGYWRLGPLERDNLRKYFDRGGFVLFDDFAGRDWNNFYFNIKQVFPDREPVLLPNDHPVWTIYFDIDPVMAPSAKLRGGYLEDQYYAIFDDDDRMVFLACYNQDIGDGWEHPFGRRVLAEASTVSFQMGVNFIIYALSH
jgi:hypothetical protein